MTNLDALKTKYEMRQIPCEICGSEHSHMFQNYGRISEPGNLWKHAGYYLS